MVPNYTRKVTSMANYTTIDSAEMSSTPGVGLDAPDDSNNGAVNDEEIWTTVSTVVGVVFLCLLLAGIAYWYYVRYGVPSCLKCCGDSNKDDLQMGYIPANITVNQAAIEQGVPDIFVRPDSHHSGRISSVEPSSIDMSQDLASGVETSGTWAEYLRATLSMRRSAAAASYRATLAESSNRDREKVASRTASEPAPSVQSDFEVNSSVTRSRSVSEPR